MWIFHPACRRAMPAERPAIPAPTTRAVRVNDLGAG
jgi:hypothetical protein